VNLRSPAELYIKYLICHPDGFSDLLIKSALEELDILYVGDTYLASLRSRCVPPTPFRPHDPLHKKSHRFLIAENIRSLFMQTNDTKIAFKILEKPRIREFVESSILSYAPDAAIAVRATSYGMRCTAGAISEYKKYFWNVDLLSATQMRTILNMELDQSVVDSDAKDVKDRKRAMKRASYLDPRKLAADLPHSPITALMAQMRMGVMPNRMELGKILQQAQAMAGLKVLEATMFGSPQDSQTALNFSTVVRNMTEALETVIKPDEHLREQLQSIALRTESAPVPSIHQLSAGQHTVDIQPTLEQVTYEPVADEKPGAADAGADGQEP
jgi:hypothetical protein